MVATGGVIVSCGVLNAKRSGEKGRGVVDDEWAGEREKLGSGGEGVRGVGTLPALYCVTLCWVCFLHSLPLQ